MVLTPFAYSKDSLYPTRISTYSHFCLTYISLSFNISTHSSLCHTYENMWLPCVGHTPHTHTSTCSSLTHSACILFIYFILSLFNNLMLPPAQYWLGVKGVMIPKYGDIPISKHITPFAHLSLRRLLDPSH